MITLYYLLLHIAYSVYSSYIIIDWLNQNKTKDPMIFNSYMSLNVVLPNNTTIKVETANRKFFDIQDLNFDLFISLKNFYFSP